MSTFETFQDAAFGYASRYRAYLRTGQALMHVLGLMHQEIYHQMSIDVWENDGKTFEEAQELMDWFEEVEIRLSYQD